MKFVSAFLATLLGSTRGMSESKTAELLSHARKLNDDGTDLSWVGDMAVKYQGCHHIKQWNTQADGKDDVRIYTKRLVRFRMCPRETCSANSAGGCQSGFGDYIVDMDTYLNLYWEAKTEDQAISCVNFLAANCAHGTYQCSDGDSEEVCQYKCALSFGREDCIEGGNPAEESQQQQMEVQMYLQCQQLNNIENNQVPYYAGPYCAQQGGAIKIGVFTDDRCTEFAGVSLSTITGMYTKYTDESIVKYECTSCLEIQADSSSSSSAPRQMCGTLYESSGKCETYLSGTLGEDAINEQACNYMAGIKMVRTDGMLDVSDVRPSAVATAFIVIFAMAFAAMAFYVWYLRTRLGAKKSSFL